MHKQFFFRSLLAVGVAVAMVACAQATVTMEYVTVGNPRNPADTVVFNAGSVAYTYQIGKYEVTAGQYTEFLNSVAAKLDPYGLYNEQMAAGCHIAMEEVFDPNDPFSTTFEYTVAEQHENRPVNWVSFWDAARFCNWMHNGQADGDTETGSYTLTPEAIADNTVTRNSGATVVVASNDEWHKAAYYNPATESYYEYATSSDVQPTNVLPDTGNNANVWDGASWRFPLTEGGTYENSASPYGTFDQCGNVQEWTDTVEDPAMRILRDGVASNWAPEKRHSFAQIYPDYEGDASGVWRGLGFRVVLLSDMPQQDIPGDATGNGIVDAEDAKVLAGHWGMTTLAPGKTWWQMGDFDGDNFVGPKDAAIMAANWGFGAGETAPTAVPEPSTALLLLLGCLATLTRARRTR